MSIANENKQQALTEAVQAIGRPSFARCLANLVQAQVASDCCLILSYQDSGSPLYLYDNLSQQRDLLFSQYLSGLYAQDPFYRALRQGLGEGVYSLQQVLQHAGAPMPEYAAGFYQATGWQQELGLTICLPAGQWLTVFLGRFTRQSFSANEQTSLRHLLPLLRALCHQHWQAPLSSFVVPSQDIAANSKQANDMYSRVHHALHSFGHARLTAREQQVARGLLQGLDNDALAHQLGIGQGTVKNHRKQVYRKLAIDSQAALFARFLNHLISEDTAPRT
ncbi:helix-turn-helix transcriptional regulator [Oceanisphaera avium]|uniref:HTH luxR-type domain-containing protein n=1 Tax=Oceanisphaera avium TaxID=1903694 RepID=A0A1Y0CV51_9GAMM|nr:helix-turn-helix transcriptional regulator [Oceanisphaera avium]ART78777.1 hypothetical protein CBP12_00265 [Oceanisphaera avium]